MKKITLAILSFILSSLYTFAQDSVHVLNIRSFEPDHIFNQQINLTKLPDWVFKAGNNLNWASPNLNTSNWQLLSPSELSVKNADKTGKVEGWFRLKIRLDSSFSHVPIAFYKNSWAAVDLYIDGRKVGVFGNTAANGKPYVEHYPYFKPALPIQLIPQQNHLIALHFVDYVSPFSAKSLKSELENGTKRLLQLLSSDSIDIWTYYNKQNYFIYVTIWTTTSLILTILFWLLSFQNLYEQKIIRLLAIWGTMSTLANLGFFSEYFEFPFMIEVIIYRLSNLLYLISFAFLTIPALLILGYPLSSRLNGFFIATWMLSGIVNVFFDINWFINLITIVQILFFLFCLIRSWKKLKGAQWSIVVGVFFTFFIASLYSIIVLTGNKINPSLLITGIILPLPLAFLVYIALRFKEILAEIKEKAAAVLQVTQEKNEILANQNENLEQQVEARTAELKASQTQLIQKEKLASLGELTAGIAHEIQNPLNFVNNFSELSVDLIKEIQEERGKTPDTRDEELENELLVDLSSNQEKINLHGKRASSIVKGMLEHSRVSSGERELTDINNLSDEALRLSYHGLRAKNKDFNANFKTDFDENLLKIKLIQQDISRVLLNLINNAFYAVRNIENPLIIVSTKKVDNQVIIKVKDNGTGIPDDVKTKIFQPFFTTKPTGEGTGLGLSLSYDIITKGHGGELKVETQEGKGSEFIIVLPLKENA